MFEPKLKKIGPKVEPLESVYTRYTQIVIYNSSLYITEQFENRVTKCSGDYELCSFDGPGPGP